MTVRSFPHLSSDDVPYHRATHVRQPEVAAVEAVGDAVFFGADSAGARRTAHRRRQQLTRAWPPFEGGR